MNDWLVVLSEDNWDICAREGSLGLGRNAERRLNRMAEDDRVWVYVNRRYVDHQVPRVQELRAVARVAGPVRHLERSPWKPRGDQRFTVARPIVVERRCAVPVLHLLRTMSFAGRPPAWGMRLLDAPLRFTGEDVATFDQAIESGSSFPCRQSEWAFGRLNSLLSLFERDPVLASFAARVLGLIAEDAACPGRVAPRL